MANFREHLVQNIQSNTHKVSCVHTSYTKMSKIRVAIGRGRKVRKSVRNQDEAYIDVWKL